MSRSRRGLLPDLALAALAIALLVAARAPSDSRTAAVEAETLLVADLRGHALTVIDLGSGAGRRIALEGGPHELLRLRDRRVVASLEQAGALAVIDVATGDVLTVATGGLPHGLALEGPRDDVLVVTDRASHALRRFEVATWRELASLPAGELPHALAARPGTAPLVANAEASTFVLGGTLVPLPALAESIALSPRGDRVAFAGAEDGRVLVYDLDGTLALEVQLSGRPVRLAYSPDGRTLAVALSASRRVALLDAAGGARYVEVPGVPDGLAFDAGGGVLFVSNMAGGGVTAIDVASGRHLATYDAGISAGALLLLD